MADHTRLVNQLMAHPLHFDRDSEEDVTLLGKCILHAVDVGNVVRKFDIALFYSERVNKEMKEQVSLERE